MKLQILTTILTAIVIIAVINLIGKKNNTEIISPIPEETAPIVIPSPTPTPEPTIKGTGKASYYVAIYDGLNCDDPQCIMANGEPFDENANTMACAKRFPLGTKIKLTYKDHSEIAECTDRGGFEKLGRLFDLSKGLFERLVGKASGVISVDYEVVNNYDK